MDYYKQFATGVCDFVLSFKSERSKEGMDFYIENMPETLINSANQYLFNVKSVETLMLELQKLIMIPLLQKDLSIKDKLFFTVLIQFVVCDIIQRNLNEKLPQKSYASPKILTLGEDQYIFSQCFFTALHLAAGEQFQELKNVYPELKLYLSFMPYGSLIEHYIEQTYFSEFYIEHEIYNQGRKKSVAKYQNHLESFLRLLVFDIWHNNVIPTTREEVEGLIKHIQKELVAMGYQPIDVIGDILSSHANHSYDAVENIARLTQYGFSFDMPENSMNSMTPYYAAIGLGLNHDSINAIKEVSNPSLESVYAHYAEKKVSKELSICPPYVMYGDNDYVDITDPFNLNILKFMYENHKNELLAYKPDLFRHMLSDLSSMLFGVTESLFKTKDSLQETLPLSIADASCRNFFELLGCLLRDPDFFNANDKDHCVLDMLCILDPYYHIMMMNSGDMEIMDKNERMHVNAMAFNKECVEGKTGYFKNYSKFTKSSFYNEVFELLSPYSDALRTVAHSAVDQAKVIGEITSQDKVGDHGIFSETDPRDSHQSIITERIIPDGA